MKFYHSLLSYLGVIHHITPTTSFEIKYVCFCRCDYVWLSEPPYEDVSGTPFCGSYTPTTYRSSTRTLSINLFYSQSHKHAFTIEYTAES